MICAMFGHDEMNLQDEKHLQAYKATTQYCSRCITLQSMFQGGHEIQLSYLNLMKTVSQICQTVKITV